MAIASGCRFVFRQLLTLGRFSDKILLRKTKKSEPALTLATVLSGRVNTCAAIAGYVCILSGHYSPLFVFKN